MQLSCHGLKVSNLHLKIKVVHFSITLTVETSLRNNHYEANKKYFREQIDMNKKIVMFFDHT